MNDSEYLNTKQAAAHLNMRPKTLARYRVSGGGPVYHLLGRLVRYLREDLDRWAQSRPRKSTSDDGTALSGPKRLRPDDPGTGAAP
ncbi:MAG: helix-turn-helix domain-containing protein [Rhodospirillaceae bacterium]|nr:helix-turn-helix domain-containing protein [Rhodospirillaceae bacterium]MYH37329.1 helix-turn-helix domain-containing protein [Rhodospirillaceae bacterium]MYK59518.1 helix-turn-helix domain-containing protein [Rhodospirillaceae bacterium]